MEKLASQLIQETIKSIISKGDKPTLSSVRFELNEILFKTLTAPTKDWKIANGEMRLSIKNAEATAEHALQQKLDHANDMIEGLNEQVLSLMSAYQHSMADNQQQVAKDSATIRKLEDDLLLVTHCFEEVMFENEANQKTGSDKTGTLATLHGQLADMDAVLQQALIDNDNANKHIKQLTADNAKLAKKANSANKTPSWLNFILDDSDRQGNNHNDMYGTAT